ncbi:hypothetical protein OEZ86_013216 [Tetradesmus obliquus]|nr:hypothetical protein OEZ86_013216 [Tetradesmus obliquus]
MPHPGVWERAFLETLRAMARRGLVTLETLPRWQVHFAAWQALSEQFQLLKNWGGFLAANHKVWMAMWERGLPPDADGGRVDVCLVMPYLLWRPQQHGSGSGGSGGSGGGAPGKAGAGGKFIGQQRRRLLLRLMSLAVSQMLTCLVWALAPAPPRPGAM